SSIGVSKAAKRVAAVHVYFNVFGTAVFLTLYYILDSIFKFAFSSFAIDPLGIAMVHTVFNVATTILLFPFIKKLEKLAVKTVKEKESVSKDVFLDERLLATPSLAVSECRNYTAQMAVTAQETMRRAVSLLNGYSAKTAEAIKENEQKLDNYEDKLGTFLVKISSQQLSDADSNTVSTLLHTIGDFERIGDHALNIVKVAKEISDKNISFSEQAQKELKVAANAIEDILSITVKSFCEGDPALALDVEPLEQVIDKMLSEIKKRHINRLTGGSCTIELGFVLSDLLTNYERVSDHCSNIAVCIIQISKSVFDTHEYLNEYKNTGGEYFTNAYNEYKEKYILP
ncbi:MAG: Na/Pi cotransporter family protein, partial [Clostridia bacterium]|nr:Na/Pi cotransporter family protein [Clostridia bacterium]